MNHRINILLLTTLLVVPSVFAGEHFRTGWFRYAPYGHSLYADVHPYFVRADITAMRTYPVYNFASTNKAYRCETEGLFGMNLPVWNMNFGKDKRYGISFSLALSADIWMDLFEKTTSPIVNTDYRIAAPTTTFIHRLNRGFLHNYSIAFSPFKHESTHIGDEMVIQRTLNDRALRRVNVSYNYTELQLTVNEPEDRMSACHTFRAGAFLLLDPKRGWYFVKEEANDGDPSFVHPRMSPWEAWIQYQYQSPTGKHGWQAIVSAEVRNRAIYGYDLSLNADEKEKDAAVESRCFTYNVFAGARYNIPGYDGYFSRVSMGVRAYHGNCPYGMFRSVNNFSQIGFCAIFQ